MAVNAPERVQAETDRRGPIIFVMKLEAILQPTLDDPHSDAKRTTEGKALVDGMIGRDGQRQVERTGIASALKRFVAD